MTGKIRGEQIKNDSITGDDIDESTLVMTHFTTHKYTNTSGSGACLMKFNTAGSDSLDGDQVNNKFVAPAGGRLVQIKFRTTGTPGATTLSLMKISDGTENFGNPGSPVSTAAINASNANIVYTANFTSNNRFLSGDVLGIQVEPTSNHGNVDLTCIWEFIFSTS